ncbi:uncharacterized protein LOC123306703 [Coccinella septempunctata]|uniref:uncharacterized protein LOC123306703 n=1 Tax=Coccinella septempunctata TaxID=41139 RepID=UPI001D0950DA|nr:uncharacterized protein LOC123306703 [Coccinella septempunctata]
MEGRKLIDHFRVFREFGAYNNSVRKKSLKCGVCCSVETNNIDIMSWSRDQVSLLIEEYHKYPCLYAVKSPMYRNKHARNTAIEAIEASLKTLRPSVTSQEIKSKFQALKTNFMNEHRKHVQSMKSGAGQDEIYIPSLWYFNSMKFIIDHVDVRPSFDSSQFLEIEAAPQEAEECSNELEQCFVAESGFLISEESELPLESPRPKRKKKLDDDSNSLLKEASAALSTISKTISEAPTNKNKETDAEEAFGKYVVSKMRQISDPQVKSDVEERIINLLFEGIRGCRNKI